MQDALPYTTFPIYPHLGQAPNVLACITGGLVCDYICVRVTLMKLFTAAVYLRCMSGDNDAILVLLLIPRLMAKCQLLMTQVRDKVK